MRVRVVVLLACAALLAAPAADAHASLSRTVPPSLAGLPEPPAEVRVRFSEPLVLEQTYVGIFDDALLRRDVGNEHLRLDSADPRVLVIPTGHLTRGLYTISYETISAQDGHRETGSLPMSIDVPCPACLAAPEAGGWDDLAWTGAALRAAAYAGAGSVLGEALLRWTVGGARTSRLRVAATVAGAVALAWPAPARPDAWSLAGAVALAAGAAFLRARSAWPLAAAGLVSVAAIVANGHSTGGDRVVAGAHAAAMLAWVGSLPALAVHLRTGAGTVGGLRRFSRAATAAVAILAATALALSLSRIPRQAFDLAHPYVQAWAGKLLLAAGLLAVAALSHRRLWRGLRARADHDVDVPAVARRVGRESLLGVLVVVATAVLASLPPPVATTTPAFTAQLWHGDARVGLRITGALDGDGDLLPGHHRYELRLWDLDGEPIRDAQVRLQFRHGTLPIGLLETTLRPQGSAYVDEGTYLGALGPWDIEALFRLPGGASEQRVRFNVDLGTLTHFHGGGRLSDPHFDTGYLNQGGSYLVGFGADDVGTFQVHCHPHPWMQMQLEVRDNATSTGEVTVRILGNASDGAGQMRFVPDRLAVRPGTLVRFVNEGDIAHTATNVRWTAA